MILFFIFKNPRHVTYPRPSTLYPRPSTLHQNPNSISSPLQDLKDGGGRPFTSHTYVSSFIRNRMISMTHFNVSDATTRFAQFLEEKFIDLVSAMSRNSIVNEHNSYSGRNGKYLERVCSK